MNRKTKSLYDILTWQTQNGARVLFVKRDQIPIVEISVNFYAGSYFDHKQFGLSQITNVMIGKATRKLRCAEITAGFENVNAQFFTTADRDMASINLRSLSGKTYFSKALAHFIAVLGEAQFSDEVLAQVKNDVIHAILHQEKTPYLLARNIFYEKLYEQHPYGHAILGTEKTVTMMTPQDLNTFYQEYYVAKNAVVTIVGNLSLAAAKETANKITLNLPAGRTAMISPIPLKKEIVKPISIPFSSRQNYFLAGQVAVFEQDPDIYALIVANSIFGQSQVSWLDNNIRKKLGLAYTAMSHLNSLIGGGPWLMIIETGAEDSEQAITKAYALLRKFVEVGPTKEEVKRFKERLVNQFPLTLIENSAITNYLRRIGCYHLPLDYLDQYANHISLVKRETIKKVCQILHPANIRAVEVGM